MYDDRWVALVYLWSVLHDRPQGWACDPDHWPDDLDRPLPSQGHLSRRLRRVGVQQLLERLLAAVSDLSPRVPGAAGEGRRLQASGGRGAQPGPRRQAGPGG